MTARRRCAFTLIELLVVISIIALLISILLPVLGAARKNAELVQCINQVRSFVIATTAHATDNNGFITHPNWNPNSGGWLYEVERFNNAYAAPSDYADYEQRVELRETGQLASYMNYAGEAYHCPSDQGPFNNTSVPVRAMTSYAFNGALCGYGRLKPQETYRIDRFKTDDVSMWETDEKRTGGYWNDGANLPNEGISARHVDGATFGKIDGSTVQVSQAEYNERVNDPEANPLWCNPGTDNGR